MRPEISYDISIGQTTEKPMTAEHEQAIVDQGWVDLRTARNVLLSESDWTQVSDAPVDHTAWATYRQALRDLPATTTDPLEPVWPTPPS